MRYFLARCCFVTLHTFTRCWEIMLLAITFFPACMLARRHQTRHFRKRATSAPAEGPAYGLHFARRCEFLLRAFAGAGVACSPKSHVSVPPGGAHGGAHCTCIDFCPPKLILLVLLIIIGVIYFIIILIISIIKWLVNVSLCVCDSAAAQYSEVHK